MRLPLGYIEKRGGCVIKKVREYGYKYVVYIGCTCYRFASITQARTFVDKSLTI
jgi:hypothetical protein